MSIWVCKSLCVPSFINLIYRLNLLSTVHVKVPGNDRLLFCVLVVEVPSGDALETQSGGQGDRSKLKRCILPTARGLPMYVCLVPTMLSSQLFVVL